ncbi:MAG: hypothetical protein WAW88_12205 [Nocardioides sp.]
MTVAASCEVPEELSDGTNHIAHVVVDQPGNTGVTRANTAPLPNLQLFKITRQVRASQDATVMAAYFYQQPVVGSPVNMA